MVKIQKTCIFPQQFKFYPNFPPEKKLRKIIVEAKSLKENQISTSIRASFKKLHHKNVGQM